MIFRKKGAGSRILEDFSLAFFTHCYGHALNLAVGDMIRVEPLLKEIQTFKTY